MALLAASLSMLLLAYGISMTALVGILFAGYLAHFGAKACLLLGENGYMHPLVAGWFVPLALFAATSVVLLVVERQRKG
jgi:lipopolysaccharide export LptBFGC system permease protein LptF